MKTADNAATLCGILGKIRKNQEILYVPTMGSLHLGHEKLIEKAKSQSGFTCVSIFVNQEQFLDQRDYDSYPKHQKHDVEICQKLNVDLLFMPSARETNSDDPPQLLCSMEKLTRTLCGRLRKKHFSGVIYILLKFFYQIQPDRVFLGKKDYQQMRIVQRLIKDLGLNIKVHSMDTIRDQDGLAYSSRNERLSTQGHEAARLIYHGLCLGKKAIAESQKDCSSICRIIRDAIHSNNLNRVEYAEIVRAHDLSPIEKIDTRDKKILIAVAVFVENIRLIDNVEYIA